MCFWVTHRLCFLLFFSHLRPVNVFLNSIFFCSPQNTHKKKKEKTKENNETISMLTQIYFLSCDEFVRDLRCSSQVEAILIVLRLNLSFLSRIVYAHWWVRELTLIANSLLFHWVDTVKPLPSARNRRYISFLGATLYVFPLPCEPMDRYRRK